MRKVCVAISRAINVPAEECAEALVQPRGPRRLMQPRRCDARLQLSELQVERAVEGARLGERRAQIG